MAQSLCELQAELKHMSSDTSTMIAETGTIPSCQTAEIKHFAPETPLGKESKKRSRVRKHSTEKKPLEATENHAITTIGNFPSPRELASLDEKFLAKRCNLGYRAIRIINLARGVIEGQIQLQELEYSCGTLSLSDYDKLVEKMRTIDGFGPFTSSNVLMCMGFYHVIPTDSETIRHLRQVVFFPFHFSHYPFISSF